MPLLIILFKILEASLSVAVGIFPLCVFRTVDLGVVPGKATW